MTAGSDAIIAKLKENGGPITRSRYIAFRYFGDPPEELTAEEESEIPDYPWDDEGGDGGVSDGDDRGAGAAGG
jgi:hypothetical protein